MSSLLISQQTHALNHSCVHKKHKLQNNFEDLPILPPLKWVGGKRWFVPHIQPYWNKYSSCRLVELFCGSLAVSLGLKPKKALLNDINKPLIHFFKNLKKGLIADSSFKNSKIFYYKARKQFNDLLKKDSWCQETAELFYYLNRTGYNGLCRFNTKESLTFLLADIKSLIIKTIFLIIREPLKAGFFLA